MIGANSKKVIRRNIVDMMSVRGFVQVLEDKNMKDEDELLDLFMRENYRLTFVSSKDPEKKVIVLAYFLLAAKNGVSAQTIKNLFTEEITINHIIFVTSDKLGFYARREIKKILAAREMEKDSHVEEFKTTAFYSNIMKHALMPKFKLMAKKECEKIKATFAAKLPQIKLDDPVALYFDARVGDVFEIFRKGGSIYYRTVVN